MLTVNSNEKSYKVKFEENSAFAGNIDEKDFNLDMIEVKDGSFHLIKENRSYNLEVLDADYDKKSFKIKVNGSVHELNVQDKFDLLLESMGMSNLTETKISELKAPMPGLVLDIKVAAGEEIAKGDPLLVLEAMKMENIIKSPTDGIVKDIKVDRSTAVEKNEILIEFE